MASHIEIVNGLIDDWKKGDIDGVLSRLCRDVEYHYLVGERPLIGKDWVRRFLQKFGAGQTDIQWRIVNHASDGDKMLVEGIDDYVDADGVRIRTPYMGIFEFRNGKICGWRDYVDTGLIAHAKSGRAFPEWLASILNQGGPL